MTLEHIVNAAVAIMVGLMGWLAAQWGKLRSDVTDLRTRAAVLEARYDAVPGVLKEIKDEIKGLRSDFSAEMRALHERVDEKADRQ